MTAFGDHRCILMARGYRQALCSAVIMAAMSVSLGVQHAAAQDRPLQPQHSAKPDMHRVLMIPVNLRGRTQLTLDRNQIIQVLYGKENSVASHYHLVSFGEVEFAGSNRDVVDPVTLPEPVDFCNTGLGHLSGAAESEMQRRGIALSAYQHFVFVLPKDAPCWWKSRSGRHRW